MGPEPGAKNSGSSRQPPNYYVRAVGYMQPITLSYGSNWIGHRTNSFINLLQRDFVPFLLNSSV
jgi:hypothetical protein